MANYHCVCTFYVMVQGSNTEGNCTGLLFESVIVTEYFYFIHLTLCVAFGYSFHFQWLILMSA